MDSTGTDADKTTEGQLTLSKMLGALDKDVASGVERRLKKLSKKHQIKVPLDKNKADQLQRKAAYSTVSEEVTKWEPIVKRNRTAKHIEFPLDRERDVLPSISSSLGDIKPINALEEEVKNVIGGSQTVLHDNKEFSKAEEKYLKAISVEEAEERHRELQRMRVLLSSYASKMRRQKLIKSKSYRRLLKHERIRKHVKKVESDKDLLLEELERLQRLRAKERASLKHKNTGKWAKHAKFRAKYDDAARQAMIEQIGLAEKFLERPAPLESESEEDEDDKSNSGVEEDSDSEAEENATRQELAKNNSKKTIDTNDRLIVSNELINNRMKRKSKDSVNNDDSRAAEDGDSEMDTDDDDDDRRKLMSEAFADDDVVDEFRKAKDKMADEEQPKDKDTFLPGWGAWTGPGIKKTKYKRSKYIIKAKKIQRKDANLGNVIISEQANDKMKDLMMSKLPRGIKNDDQLTRMLTRPTASTFTSQSMHRDSIRPRVEIKMGTRIEPMSKRVLQSNKAKWA